MIYKQFAQNLLNSQDTTNKKDIACGCLNVLERTDDYTVNEIEKTLYILHKNLNIPLVSSNKIDINEIAKYFWNTKINSAYKLFNENLKNDKHKFTKH